MLYGIILSGYPYEKKKYTFKFRVDLHVSENNHIWLPTE